MVSASRYACICLAVLGSFATVSAQQPPIATASQSFAFDYKDAEIAGVTRFEMQLDGGDWVDVRIPSKQNDSSTPANYSTYVVPIPALVTGNHSVAFRACNATLCSDSSAPLSFVLVVKPSAPASPRIK